MHMTDLAPVLSATSSRDCIWIMFVLSSQLEGAPRRTDSLGPREWARARHRGRSPRLCHGQAGSRQPAPLPYFSPLACSTSVLASLTSNLPGASMLSALTTPSLTSIE